MASVGVYGFLWFYPVGLIFGMMIIDIDGLIYASLQELLSSVYTHFHCVVIKHSIRGGLTGFMNRYLCTLCSVNLFRSPDQSCTSMSLIFNAHNLP